MLTSNWRLAVLAGMFGLTLQFGGLAFGQDGDPPDCGEAASTAEILDCHRGRLAYWDARLNAAYGSLMDMLIVEARPLLRDAQRAWIAYRDANCAWYGSGEGSITAIFSATCHVRMTRARTLELESDEQ